MNFAICEDNEKERNILVDLLHKYFEERKLPLPEIYEYENAETMLEAKQGFSILFLDVELEGISGLSAGERLRKMNNRIIIFVVTSHDDYLDDAFDLHAFRYMTKPVNEARLFRSLDIAMELYKSLSKTISLETKDGKVVNLLSSDIIMVEALSRKVTFYTTDGDYQAAKSINYYAKLMTDIPFYRTHRSFIVNFRHITRFDDLNVWLGRDDAYHAYLAKRRHPGFKRAYMLYLADI